MSLKNKTWMKYQTMKTHIAEYMVVHVLLGASIQNIIYESEFWYQFMRFVGIH